MIVLATSRSFKKQVAPKDATTPMNCAVNRVAPNARASPAALLPRSSNDPGQVNGPPLLGQLAMISGSVTMAIGWLPVGKAAPQTRRWARIVTRKHA
jgi:hypothetical protein